MLFQGKDPIQSKCCCCLLLLLFIFIFLNTSKYKENACVHKPCICEAAQFPHGIPNQCFDIKQSIVLIFLQ